MAKEKFVIELGSSNTVIYKVGYGIVLKEPTIVAISNEKSNNCEVGFKAKKMQGKTDNSYSIIEPIEHGVIVNEDALALMLKSFLDKVVENKHGKIEVTFCVSIGLTDNQLMSFKNVAYVCKISDVNFVNVCLSALKGANVKIDSSKAVMCVNLGGGTCNFAVASLDKTLEGFSINFGGKDIDQAILEYVYAVKNMEISLSIAEKIKNECASLYLQDTTNMEICGVDVDTKRPVNEIITSQEIKDAIFSFFVNIKKGIEHLIKQCSADVVNDITQNGIYLVGGLSLITGLENYLTRELGLAIVIPEEPENCTVLGAIN